MGKTKAAIANARAVLQAPRTTDAQKASTTQSISQAMPSSPDWATATDLQAAVKVWSSDAAALVSNAATITSLREQLATAEAKQRAIRHDWAVSMDHVLITATVLCDGNPERVMALSLSVESRSSVGPLAAPEKLVVSPGKAGGEVLVTWARGNAHHGFIVQHASDPTNVATLSTPMPWTKIRFTLGGLATNAAVSFRVAAIDPTSATGAGPWTTWVLGNAR